MPLDAEMGGDPLGAALLPVLLHKLNNATQLLTGMNSLLAMEGGESVVFEKSDDLARTSRKIDDLGWLLAVLASASGANLLLERRERRGLRLMVELVSDGLRRSGRSLAHSDRALPELAPGALDGWQLPWATGALLWAAAEDLERGAVLSFQLERVGDRARFSAPASPAVERLLPLVRERLPRAEISVADGSFLLDLPGSWLLFEDDA